MEDEPKSITQWIRELIARSLAEQTQLMQRFGDLLRHAASGEIEQRRVPREYTRLFREETTRYIADLARLGISYYNSLLELNRSHSDRLFEQMSGPRTDREPASTPDAPLPQRIEMDLTAVPGEEALQSFVIENTRSETVNVSFLVSEFQSVDGTSSFRPMLQIQPERFTLRSGEERVVTVRLPLSVELFVPGHRYSATVAVGGYDDIVLALNAWAEGPPAPDNLTQLRGIGPEYATRLQKAGITTFAQLAATQERELADILGIGGLQRAKRDQWVAQARLATDGKEAELEALQVRLRSRKAPQQGNDGIEVKEGLP